MSPDVKIDFGYSKLLVTNRTVFEVAQSNGSSSTLVVLQDAIITASDSNVVAAVDWRLIEKIYGILAIRLSGSPV